MFGLKEKDAFSLFAVNSASVYAIRQAIAKQKGLEFNGNKSVLGVALIYSHYRIVLEARTGKKIFTSHQSVGYVLDYYRFEFCKRNVSNLFSNAPDCL